MAKIGGRCELVRCDLTFRGQSDPTSDSAVASGAFTLDVVTSQFVLLLWLSCSDLITILLRYISYRHNLSSSSSAAEALSSTYRLLSALMYLCIVSFIIRLCLEVRAIAAVPQCVTSSEILLLR